jgi:hypothetical protein
MLAMHLFVGNMQQNLVEGKSRDFYLSTEMIGLYQDYNQLGAPLLIQMYFRPSS